MMDNSISQSTSFKRVMNAVLSEEDAFNQQQQQQQQPPHF